MFIYMFMYMSTCMYMSCTCHHIIMYLVSFVCLGVSSI